jgi:ataxin-3
LQVLAKALDVWDLKLTSLDSRDAQAAKENPQQEVAFICHLHDHWFTIRRVGDQWYNFNSLFPAPEHLSNFYLSAFLGSLQSEGWSIFVVRGNFPTECVFSSESGNSFGQWLTPEDAERISKSTKTSSKVVEEDDPTLKAAIKASLEDSTSNIGFGNQSISSLAASMAASLADVKVPEDKWRKAS